MSHSTTPSRFKVNSMSPAQKARPKSAPPEDAKKDPKLRRSLLLVVNKPKSGEEVASQKEDVRMMRRSPNRAVVEQFSRPRRKRPVDSRKNEEESKKESESQERLIKDLRSEVLSLKAELDKAHRLNKELESQNNKLEQDLAAAEAKLVALNTTPDQDKESVGEYQRCKFKDIQKLIANKLEHSTVLKEGIDRANAVNPKWAPPPPLIPPTSKADDAERVPPTLPSLPPPPPLPPPRSLARASTARMTPPILEFYHSLRKQEQKTDTQRPANQFKPPATSAHSSIVGEIQNRSAHLLAIKADIETKGDFINSLIQKVLAAAYTDIEDVLRFTDWLDSELSLLADERAVLKHFNWPEKKADAVREAAIEYRALKLLESEISSYEDDTNIPCGAALKKMASLLDKSERSIQRLIKLRNSVIRSYQVWKIPVDWMLDSGIVCKIRQASMNLVKAYMKRVMSELELVRNSDRELNQEALLLQGVHFAHRAYQFAGGLDSETLCAFEEIRRRIPGNVGLGGTRGLLGAIPSS